MAGKITGGGARGAKGAGKGGNGRTLTVVDNMSPEDKLKAAFAEKKAREEAETIQLMSVVARVKQALPEVEAARVVLKAAQDKVNSILLSAKAQSKEFERGRIMDLVKDSSPSERRNVQHNEAVRARFRRAMGLPVGDISQEELELHHRLPPVEQDGQYWEGVGYTDGVSGADKDAPLECVKAGHGNRYETGWTNGQKILALAMTKTKAPVAAPVEPEETEVERRVREKREEKIGKEALAKIGLGEDGQPTLEGLIAKRDQIVAEGGTAPPHILTAITKLQAAADFAADNPASDGFEATPEELAAQTTRAAVQAAKEADPDVIV
jgi:hypothetical protein